MSVLRTDEAPLSKALEHVESTVDQDVTFPRVACDVAYLAVRAPFMMDSPTKSELMQNTLFVL